MPPPTPPDTRASGSFRLTRYFALASLLGVILVMVSLVLIYRSAMLRQVMEHATRDNAALGQLLANRLMDPLQGFVRESRGLNREALLAHPGSAALDTMVKGTVRGLNVAKVKIYNLEGTTIYSTDPRQIGENQAANPAVIRAVLGESVSDITHRDSFDSFEGRLVDRDMVFTYLPVYHLEQPSPAAVLEVYADVTEVIAHQRETLWSLAGTVLATLSVLYVFLATIVHRAARVIARQDAERAEREAQIRHQAMHDALTGLPNRTSFLDRLRQSLAAASRQHGNVAVMFIDLDRFKIVNDSLGHTVGDHLLSTVAQRIREDLRASDMLFRMGGDEFTVILPDAGPPEAVAHVAQRIVDSARLPVQLLGHDVVAGASIGIAIYPSDGASAEELVKNADSAMYSVKQNGGSGHGFYRAEMNERAMARLSLEAELQRACRNQEFVLHYQPRIDAASRKVVAVEALLRWQSPRRGLVPPVEFIGVLEDSGLMQLAGEWVLRSACEQLVQWRRQGLPLLRVSVNVSARQFQAPDFAQIVRQVLESTGVDPSFLELELTESLLITSPDQAAGTLAALKALGVTISIDDFGTGYSSMNYLRHLAVDYLKIDRSFVKEVATSPRDRAVATAIADVARALGITLVAEGVETEAQAAFFCDIHCGEMQGFLFSRPLTADALASYLKEHGAVPMPAVDARNAVAGPAQNPGTGADAPTPVAVD